MKGWISLHRSITNHWVWQDPVKLKWWLDILMSVNHEDKKVNVGMQLFECKRGQSIMSLNSWAKRWKVSKSMVNRFFDLLKNDAMITTENLAKTTRITVCNYDTYQDWRNADETIEERKRNVNETLPKSNNNDNNVNNDNTIVESDDSTSELAFENIWELYGKKGNRKTSIQRWDRLSKAKKKLALANIPLYVKTTPDKQFRKGFEVYINQEVWNDEIVVPEALSLEPDRVVLTME